jgi:hypothetical protein
MKDIKLVMRNKRLSLGIAIAVVAIHRFFLQNFLGRIYPSSRRGSIVAEGDAPMSVSLSQAKEQAD